MTKGNRINETYVCARPTIFRVDIDAGEKPGSRYRNSRKSRDLSLTFPGSGVRARAILLIYRGRVIISRGHNTHCYVSISFVAGRKGEARQAGRRARIASGARTHASYHEAENAAV